MAWSQSNGLDRGDVLDEDPRIFDDDAVDHQPEDLLLGGERGIDQGVVNAGAEALHPVDATPAPCLSVDGGSTVMIGDDMMATDAWGFSEWAASRNAVERALDGLRRTAGGPQTGQAPLIDAAMRLARQNNTGGLPVAAAVLRYLVEEAAPSQSIPMCGDLPTWKTIAGHVDRNAWFAAAGADARTTYDAVMDSFAQEHRLTGRRPTMREILDAIAALPDPVMVAGILDFATGFLDNAETADLVSRFVALVIDTAVERRA